MLDMQPVLYGHGLQMFNNTKKEFGVSQYLKKNEKHCGCLVAWSQKCGSFVGPKISFDSSTAGFNRWNRPHWEPIGTGTSPTFRHMGTGLKSPSQSDQKKIMIVPIKTY